MSSEIYTKEFPFPVTVKFLVTDTIAALRPKLKLYENLDEAIQGVEDLIKELKPKFGMYLFYIFLLDMNHFVSNVILLFLMLHLHDKNFVITINIMQSLYCP